MKTIRTLTLTALVATSSLLGVAQAESKAKDIVAVASSAGSFNTLVAAVKAAGLVETLQGAGPFTVFAPTDEAFAKLPKGTVESLLKPENKEKLVAILTYHVVPAKVMAAEVKSGEVPTVNGKVLTVKADGMGVMVNNAKVIATDLVGSSMRYQPLDLISIGSSDDVPPPIDIRTIARDGDHATVEIIGVGPPAQLQLVRVGSHWKVFVS